MIPTDRPVLGRDLETVRLAFGLATQDIIWVLGMSITRWMQIVRQAPDAPVKDPALALLVRFLAQHPELAVIPKQPTAPEMLAFMNEIADIEPKRFATYFGAESSAAYRWMRPDARPSSTVTRLMHFLKTALLMQDAAGRTQLLEDWRKTVAQEARNRGVDDVFKTGRWTTPIIDNGAPSSPLKRPAAPANAED